MSLRVKDLSHTYAGGKANGQTILQPQSWTLTDGQQILIRGISGSGKTTLFNILAGLLQPSTGSICYGDQALYALPEAARDRFRARNVGYVFQNHHLIGSLTALENVVMPIAFANNLPPTQWRRRAQELLDQVGIGALSHAGPKQLSTGQRLRVAVARALANKPRVVLADEPTAALDEQSGSQVMDFLQQSCLQNHSILIVASHDPSLSQRFATTANLKSGHLQWAEAQPL